MTSSFVSSIFSSALLSCGTSRLDYSLRLIQLLRSLIPASFIGEKLKERQNYASKVKSKFAKQLHRKTPADGDDAAFAETPDFYKEVMRHKTLSVFVVAKLR